MEQIDLSLTRLCPVNNPSERPRQAEGKLSGLNVTEFDCFSNELLTSYF